MIAAVMFIIIVIAIIIIVIITSSNSVLIIIIIIIIIVIINPQTKHLDFQGFDSVRFLIPRGGIPRSIGHLPENRTQIFLAWGFLVCGLAIPHALGCLTSFSTVELTSSS